MVYTVKLKSVKTASTQELWQELKTLDELGMKNSKDAKKLATELNKRPDTINVL